MQSVTKSIRTSEFGRYMVDDRCSGVVAKWGSTVL